MPTTRTTRVLGTLWCASAAVAQVQWNAMAPSTVPAARHGQAMTFDPLSQRIVLFGGNTAAIGQSGFVADLWQWTGSDWLLLAPTGALPSPRAWSAWCEESSTGTLLFGGSWHATFGGVVVYGDTFRLQGNQWTQVANTGPAPRDGHAMVRTPQGVLLFGGNAPQTFTVVLNDTWLWNGSAWTQLSPPASPARRSRHRMAYDEWRGVVVLFGGRDTGATNFADTWEWNGSNWTPRASLHAPSSRYAHAMDFSPSTGRTIVFGGSTWNGSANIVLADTWLWDGSDWQQAATTPPPAARYETAMAFSPGNQGAILFGGFTTSGNDNGTHRLLEPAATVTAFGAGCPGPNSLVPTLAAAPGALPRLGTTMQFRVGNLPPTFTVPMLALGLSNTLAAGPPPYALPFDLSVLGWPGCQQLVSLDATDATASFASFVDFPLGIPLAVALLGFTFHGQAIVFYQPTGVAVSNGVTAVVGS